MALFFHRVDNGLVGSPGSLCVLERLLKIHRCEFRLLQVDRNALRNKMRESFCPCCRRNKNGLAIRKFEKRRQFPPDVEHFPRDSFVGRRQIWSVFPRDKETVTLAHWFVSGHSHIYIFADVHNSVFKSTICKTKSTIIEGFGDLTGFTTLLFFFFSGFFPLRSFPG